MATHGHILCHSDTAAALSVCFIFRFTKFNAKLSAGRALSSEHHSVVYMMLLFCL